MKRGKTMKKNEISEMIEFGTPVETSRVVYEEIPFTLTWKGEEHNGFAIRVSYLYDGLGNDDCEIQDVIWTDEEPKGITAEMIDSIMDGALDQ
jgi:hypothetical protein